MSPSLVLLKCAGKRGAEVLRTSSASCSMALFSLRRGTSSACGALDVIAQAHRVYR